MGKDEETKIIVEYWGLFFHSMFDVGRSSFKKSAYGD